MNFIKFLITMTMIVFGMAALTNAVQAESHTVDAPIYQTEAPLQLYLVTVFFDDFGVGYIKDGVDPMKADDYAACKRGGQYTLNYFQQKDTKLRFVILCVKLRSDWTINQLVADIIKEFAPQFPPLIMPVPKERSGYGNSNDPTHFHDESDA